VRAQVEDSWKRDNVLRFDRPQDLVVTAPIASLAEWVELKKRLTGIAFLRKTEIKTLSRNEAVLALSFLGDEEQLAAVLAQRDLALVQDGPGWTLTVRDK
jgi:hypothetical protein